MQSNDSRLRQAWISLGDSNDKVESTQSFSDPLAGVHRQLNSACVCKNENIYAIVNNKPQPGGSRVNLCHLKSFSVRLRCKSVIQQLKWIDSHLKPSV